MKRNIPIRFLHKKRPNGYLTSDDIEPVKRPLRRATGRERALIYIFYAIIYAITALLLLWLIILWTTPKEGPPLIEFGSDKMYRLCFIFCLLGAVAGVILYAFLSRYDPYDTDEYEKMREVEKKKKAYLREMARVYFKDRESAGRSASKKKPIADFDLKE